MIITITDFKMSKPVTSDEAKAIFLTTAPNYRGVAALYRKSYVVAEDGLSVGGIYLWNSRAEAEAVFTESWRTFVRGKYNSEPTVTYFDSPVTVDNVTHEIVSDA